MQFLGIFGELRGREFQKFESRHGAAFLGRSLRTDVGRKISQESSLFSPGRILEENVSDFKSASLYRNFSPFRGMF